MKEENADLETETIVVTSEQGVVLTGSRMEAFEGRIMASVRKPYLVGALLIAFIFVVLIGITVFLSRSNNTLDHQQETIAQLSETVKDLKATVHNTDRIVSEVTGPEAKARQTVALKELVTNLTNEMDCRDQQNLQRLVNKLIAAGLSDLKAVGTVVEPRCQTSGG